MKRFLWVWFLFVLGGCNGNPPAPPAPPVPQTVSDSYPGDSEYTNKVERLLDSVEADRINLPWAGNRTLSKGELCEELVNRHFVGLSPGQGETNANFLDCPDLTADMLLNACVDALTNPRGFDGPDGWDAWRGTHDGAWFNDDGQRFDDSAEWDPPRKEPTRVPGDNDANGNPREYDCQDVRWPGPPPRSGWNQSHPEVPYVWGWDPKEGRDENGEIGTHIGFPFEVPPCEFIIWLTPKEAFLEGINTGQPETRAVNGRTVRGYPKTSTGLNGRGQWAVDR